MGTDSAWAGVPEVKVVTPALPRPVLERPALAARLDGILDRRLTTVVAGAGFGKSTQLAAWSRRAPTAWYTVSHEDGDPLTLARGLFHALRLRVPGLTADVSLAAEAARGPDAGSDEESRGVAYAGFLASALAERVSGALAVVLDDVHEIDGTPAVSLVEAFCRQAPPDVHVVLAGRTEPPFPVGRLRGQGQLLEVSGAELRFTIAETEALLIAELGDAARDLAPVLHGRTEGWPAAVRLAVEALHGTSRDQWAEAMAGTRTGSRLFAYLAEEVMDRLDPEAVELVRRLAPVERFTAGLAAALGIDHVDALFERLERRGLFLVPSGTQGWFALDPLVRSYANERLPLGEQERAAVMGRAAVWLEANGEISAALDCLAAAGDHAGLARALVANGERLLSGGWAVRVAELAESLPADLRSPGIDRVEGEAAHAIGDWDRAMACFGRLVDGDEPVPAAVAWRLGLIHHMRGNLDQAITVYQKAADDPEPSPDHAQVLAWSAAAWWLRGDVKRCRELAEAADAEARACGDHRAAASAQTALALVAAMDGDRRANDAHYIKALDHAERAGDVLQIIRIRANRGSRHVEEGAYEEALAELDVALRLADLTGFGSWRALSLLNRGQALLRLGRLEEARRDLEASRAGYQRLGSRMVSWPLASLGDVHRARGDTALARAAYEEALGVADPPGDIQGIVPALAGLARVLADDDPAAAMGYAERAASHDTSLIHQWALIALGRAALAGGDRARAATVADAAAGRAGQRRDQAALAEALELQADIAVEAGDGAAAATRLDEAGAIHRSSGDPLGQARVDLCLATLLDGAPARERAVAAERRARVLGARSLTAAAARLVDTLDRQETPHLGIEALGGFRVLRRGEPVGSNEWQSRKARDLLKMLVARRGRTVHREDLAERLWPDQPSERTGSRLSVTLSTLRAVLDPDKEFEPDHFVAADRATLRLDLDHVRSDVETFLDLAREALTARNGPNPAARDRLAVAEAAYTGEFLADDPYEDWAVPLREEARSAYLHTTRVLASAMGATGDADLAARYLLRLLEQDSFDEGAHLDLVRAMVAAGRHGEARRAYHAYCARMDEIGVEPSPFPAS